jgi:hypothetical protein
MAKSLFVDSCEEFVLKFVALFLLYTSLLGKD